MFASSDISTQSNGDEIAHDVTSSTACPMASSDPPPKSPPESDSEGYTLISPVKKSTRKVVVDDDEPLVDTTEAIPLKSKKTERMQRRQQKKLQKTTVKSETASFLELPAELLQEVFSYLRPNDIFRLLRLSKAARDYISENEAQIAKDITSWRYATLSKSFHLPLFLSEVDEAAQQALLSKNWQDRLQIHKRPYTHVRTIDSAKICSCMSCMLAWNNLNVILDLSFFQRHLDDREPIPMIPRGTFPEWNRKLIERNASLVERAMSSPLVHAAILQTHLNTIVSTLTRQVRVGKKTCHPRRLFHLSTQDIESGTDAFLERSGPPSYEFPYHRDNYYSLEAYMPNRKWDKEEQKWLYAALGKPHENDVAWVVARFGTEKGEKERMQIERLAADLARRLQT